MTPAERSALMAAAKPVARQFAIAVKSRSAHQAQQVMGDLDAEMRGAVAVVLAAAVDLRLLDDVCAAGDDGLPAEVNRIHHREEANAA